MLIDFIPQGRQSGPGCPSLPTLGPPFPERFPGSKMPPWACASRPSGWRLSGAHPCLPGAATGSGSPTCAYQGEEQGVSGHDGNEVRGPGAVGQVLDLHLEDLHSEDFHGGMVECPPQRTCD